MKKKNKGHKKEGQNLNYSVLDKNPGQWQNRIIIGTPMTGLVRAEWAFARYSQIIPTNWSNVDITQFMSSYIPLEYQVADAENIIARVVVEKDFEWLLFLESDNIIPPDTFIKMNQYMIDGKIPIVGGLYFTKSIPPEPLVYREAGRGYYDKWKMGDKVWVSGLPFGCTLIHGSIIKAMWKESPEYVVSGQTTRRIFDAPNSAWNDPEKGGWIANRGTSDLAWCKRVIDKRFLEKAGWEDFAKEHPKFPFLVDTTIFVRHISPEGQQFPITIPDQFIPPKGYVPKNIVN